MSASNSVRHSQDVEKYRREYANELYDEYCELHNSLIAHMCEYNKRENKKILY